MKSAIQASFSIPNVNDRMITAFLEVLKSDACCYMIEMNIQGSITILLTNWSGNAIFIRSAENRNSMTNENTLVDEVHYSLYFCVVDETYTPVVFQTGN
jgi:hypothetical protein